MDPELRSFARAGALAMCVRAITEFPDILAELNAMAKSSPRMGEATKPRRVARAASRPKWSAARRKAHSDMMKKRWAARKSKRGGKKLVTT